jgi:hypothetical protein
MALDEFDSQYSDMHGETSRVLQLSPFDVTLAARHRLALRSLADSADDAGAQMHCWPRPP